MGKPAGPSLYLAAILSTGARGGFQKWESDGVILVLKDLMPSPIFGDKTQHHHGLPDSSRVVLPFAFFQLFWLLFWSHAGPTPVLGK